MKSKGGSRRAANICILQSGRFSTMDKIFPESGRLSNLCAQISLFSLKIRKSPAELGRVGSSDHAMPSSCKRNCLTPSSLTSRRGQGAECPWQWKICQKIRKKREKWGRLFHFTSPDREGWLRYCLHLFTWWHQRQQIFHGEIPTIGADWTEWVKIFNWKERIEQAQD